MIGKIERYNETMETPNLIKNAAKAGSEQEQFSRLLADGCGEFGLPIGIISYINSGAYTVVASVSTVVDIEPGTKFDLSNTYCFHTLAAGKPTGFHHVGNSEIQTHPCYQAFGLEAYIGAPIIIDGNVVGTINFSSPTERSSEFTDADYALVQAMAEWLATKHASAFC